MSSQLAPYGMSQHHLLHLSSNLLPPLHMAEKAPAPAESQQGSENEKSEHFQLQRVRSSSPSRQKEQNASCQAVNAAPRPLGLHDLNRQPKTEQASWAERLCHTTFFNPCSQHSSKVYRRCEVGSLILCTRNDMAVTLDHTGTSLLMIGPVATAMTL